MNDIKSKWKSKTYISGVLMALLGLASAVGLIPDTDVAEGQTIIGAIVAAGGLLIARFRKTASAALV